MSKWLFLKKRDYSLKVREMATQYVPVVTFSEVIDDIMQHKNESSIKTKMWLF